MIKRTRRLPAANAYQPPASRRAVDVIIVGAGPAGLSAALVLGRCGRSTLIFDRGTPRSWASRHMHGFLTRDGLAPTEFFKAARKDLTQYRDVGIIDAQVEHVGKSDDGGFVISSKGHQPRRCRKLLIATGLFDDLPKVEGMAELFGNGVFQCPYCDGWELRGQRLVAYGSKQRGYEMAKALTAWSSNVALCSDGPSGLNALQRAALDRHHIPVIEAPLARLITVNGKLGGVAFKVGAHLDCDALFFDTSSRQQCNIAQLAGCEFTERGGIRCNRLRESSVPGVFVAGNITRDVQLSIVAAAEGAKAAFAINRALTREDFGPP